MAKRFAASILAETLHKDLTLASLVKGSSSPQEIQQRQEGRKLRRFNDLLPHQQAFLTDGTTRHLGLVAGFGAGKSFALCAKMLQLAEDNPGCVGIVMEPSYGMIQDILVPQTVDLWTDWGVDFEYTRSPQPQFTVKLSDGRKSICLLRSFENVARIRGINAAWALVDEIDTVRPHLATQAFRLLQGRIRAGVKPQIGVASTPEGFGFLHDFFIEHDDSSKRLIRAKTTDNPYLPPEYIASLREQYPPALIEAYLNGEFVNLAQSSIFSDYDRARCNTDLDQAEPDDRILVGMDFNIGQCMSCIAVIRQEAGSQILHIIGELKTNDTWETARQLQYLYGQQVASRRLIAYPDASGGNAHTSSTTTDHQILRQHQITVESQRQNPNPTETFAHLNALFHRGQVRVNAARCPELVASLERWAYDEAGRPIKGGVTDYSHAGDAARYLAWGCMNGANRIGRQGLRVY